MNGVHDMGGMHGFGPVVREEHEPQFHADWERHVYAMQIGVRARRIFNLDESRRGIESMDPAHYLAASYYERWLASLESNLIEKGALTRAEIDARTEALRGHPDTPLPQHEDPYLVAFLLSRSKPQPPSPPREEPPFARFQAGDAVMARNVHPKHHTRVPRYVRGKHGVIARVHGAFPLPDTNAHGLGRNPERVYSVRFDAAELWGASAEPNQLLYIDLWESYLEPA